MSKEFIEGLGGSPEAGRISKSGSFAWALFPLKCLDQKHI